MQRGIFTFCGVKLKNEEKREKRIKIKDILKANSQYGGKNEENNSFFED
ncbi:MAG TPA: hypothetical protein PLD35_00650 [Caldisericia bacterium]|jgi:hypothetical protein|nr:hypothetical protein [Caldisericia bacterium]